MYDAVVLDAPPTGRIRQFLDATSQVANLAKVGPINRQSNGVIDLLHSTNTAVHLVTLLEEMPVQETIDAAAELVAAGFRLGAVIVNRERPVLVDAGQLDAAGVGRRRDPRPRPARDGRRPGVCRRRWRAQMAQYAARQQRAAGQRRPPATSIKAPVIRLPELNPPVGVGELHELAGWFLADERADERRERGRTPRSTSTRC